PGYAPLPARQSSITRPLIEDWRAGSGAYPGGIFIVSGRRRERHERLLGKRTVSKSRNWRRAQFSIFQLRFDIWHCPEIAQCSLGIESGSPLAMSNIKSQLENGKCFSFRVSGSTDGRLSNLRKS